MSQRNTTTSAPGAAKRLTIYCPSLDITYRNFILTPSADYNQFLVELRSAVGGIAAAWPWTTGGKRSESLHSFIVTYLVMKIILMKI